MLFIAAKHSQRLYVYFCIYRNVLFNINKKIVYSVYYGLSMFLKPCMPG